MADYRYIIEELKHTDEKAAMELVFTKVSWSLMMMMKKVDIHIDEVDKDADKDEMGKRKRNHCGEVWGKWVKRFIARCHAMLVAYTPNL